MSLNEQNMNHRDKKYINKKIFKNAGEDELILKVIKLLSKSPKRSEQISVVQKMCLDVAKESDSKEKEYQNLSETIYKYAVGSSYIRVEKGRVSLTQKSKKLLGIS